MASNPKTPANSLLKKRGPLTKNNLLDRKTPYEVNINLKIQDFVKI